jgi:hypothetical protein
MGRESFTSGNEQRGFAASVEAGHGLWVLPNWSIGAVARLSGGWLAGHEFGTTNVWLPQLGAALTWH